MEENRPIAPGRVRRLSPQARDRVDIACSDARIRGRGVDRHKRVLEKGSPTAARDYYVEQAKLLEALTLRVKAASRTAGNPGLDRYAVLIKESAIAARGAARAAARGDEEDIGHAFAPAQRHAREAGTLARRLGLRACEIEK